MAGRPDSRLWADFQRRRTRANRDRLIEHHFSLLVRIAKMMRARFCQTVELGDLIGSGSIGLIRAVELFEPQRGYAFETYATRRIRGAMLDAVRDFDWVPRLVRARKEAPVSVASYFDWVDDDETLRLVDLLPHAGPDPVEAIEARDTLSVLDRCLSPRERQILLHYYRDSFSMKRIAGIFGLSEATISMNHSSAIAKIREHYAARADVLSTARR